MVAREIIGPREELNTIVVLGGHVAKLPSQYLQLSYR